MLYPLHIIGDIGQLESEKLLRRIEVAQLQDEGDTRWKGVPMSEQRSLLRRQREELGAFFVAEEGSGVEGGDFIAVRM